MKIDFDKAPKGQGTRYPAPHNEPCLNRRWVRVGDAAGLAHIGVNIVTLEPGVWSSQRHWHELEDEFVYMIEGELVLITDEGEEIMHPGDCVGFKAGVRNGHHLINRSNAVARFLVVSNRDEADSGAYSDLDMRFNADGSYAKKNGDPF
jgi:uncharacterized cupin superfamily protein